LAAAVGNLVLLVAAAMAIRDRGLAYVAEPQIASELRRRRLRGVLEAYARPGPPILPLLSEPARRSAALQGFVEALRSRPGA